MLQRSFEQEAYVALAKSSHFARFKVLERPQFLAYRMTKE